MSSTSNTTFTTSDFHFQAIFNVALENYKEKTGKDLCDLDDPLASKLDSCNSLDSILNIFQEQTKAFDEFRKGNSKLFNWLKPIVTVLYTISTNGIIVNKASSVFPPAKAVFSAIRILLSTAKDVSKSYDSLVDIFECIDNFLTRLKIYIEIPPTEAPAITKIVTQMMVELITVFALATEQINQGRFKKYAKKLLGEKEIESVLDRLRRLTDEESKMTVAQTYDIVCCLVKKIQVVMEGGKASIDDMRRSLDLMQKKVDKMERDKSQRSFSVWLSATNPWVNQNTARNVHHRSEATWFTEGDMFKKWKSESSLMWIHGLPGSGKSVLCSSIIEDIKAMCETGSATLAFFYFDFRDIHKQDARSLLSSLLIQLCRESDHYFGILSLRHSNHGDGAQQPSEEVLIECLKEMLKVPRQGKVYIVVDALDECPSFSGFPTPRERVLKILHELVDLRLSHVHFCFTSRPEVEIRSALEDLAVHKVSLHNHDGQKQDISTYIESVFSSDPKIQEWEEDDKELAKNTLLTGAEGMFLWVNRQIDTLRRCSSASVRDALDKLPKTLNETYEQTLRMINEENQHDAYRLFQCLVVSRRPLLVEELAELFAFKPNKDTISAYNARLRPKNPEAFIQSICSTLVDVVNRGGQKIVQFSHFSAREYLISDHISISKHVSDFHVLERPAHTLFATACLRVLLHLDDDIHSDKIQDFPLASYAAEYWVDHARVASVSSDLKHEMKCIFDKNKPHFAAWLRLYNIDNPTPSFMSFLQAYPAPLYYAALCGFRDIAEHLIHARRQDVNARGGLHLTPLHAALDMGHPGVAVLLLERGADIESRDSRNWTPLHKASYHGYIDVMSSLIVLGADLNAEEDNRETPLYLASKHGTQDAARLLLERHADANHPDMHGRTPLHVASQEGRDHVISLLLDHGVDVNSSNCDGWTALHFASQQGDGDTISLLLDQGADANYLDNLCQTPLHLASQHGHDHVARLLLDHGVDMNSSNGDGWTALHFASRQGYGNIIRLLLDRRADANCPSNLCQTPLHLASQHGHDHVARLLLDHGVDMNSSNSDGWTALHFASRQGYDNIIRLLLDRRADANYSNNLGQAPLHLASQHGHDHVVWLLLDHGVDMDSLNDDGWTALHFASRQGYGAIVRSLLDRGADANHPHNLGRTPLHLASQQGHDHVVRLLLDHGVDVNPSDRDGRIPLHLASYQGYNDIVVLLLDHGANANHSDSRRWTSRDVALLEGRNDTVRLLLDRSADPNSHGSAPHHIASRESYDHRSRLLLDHGQRRITGIVMPGFHYVLHRGKVVTSSSGYYSIRFESFAK